MDLGSTLSLLLITSFAQMTVQGFFVFKVSSATGRTLEGLDAQVHSLHVQTEAAIGAKLGLALRAVSVFQIQVHVISMLSQSAPVRKCLATSFTHKVFRSMNCLDVLTKLSLEGAGEATNLTRHLRSLTFPMDNFKVSLQAA